MKICYFLLLPTLLIFFSCQKENEGEPVKSSNAHLEVTVRQCATAACDTMPALPGATVYLFEHEKYRDDGTHIAAEATTGEDGRAAFTTLPGTEYWYTVSPPSALLESKKGFLQTPSRTTSFLEIIFEKE